MHTEILPFTNTIVEELEKEYIPFEKGEGWGSDTRVFRNTIWKLNKLGCTHIVVEKKYVDRDFSEDYSAYHSTSFQDHGKRCLRLHFFKSATDNLPFGSARLEVPTAESIQGINDNYYGFMIILPLQRGRIGRTIIRPYCSENNEYYCTVMTETRVNLDGVPLIAKGVPFIQQDGPVGVCSTTAIWMVARIMSLKYKFKRFSLSGITKAANKYHRINREFPAIRGLTVDQIVSGSIELGYAPLAYQRETFFGSGKTWNPKEIIYKYIESGIPVIVILGNSYGNAHAAVVIGHNFNTEKEKFDNNVVSNSVFIDSFVVHDDSLGSYMLMSDRKRVSPGAFKYEVLGEFNPFTDKPNLYTPYSLDDITNIIIPSFKKVYLEGQQVEDAIRNVLESDKSIFMKLYKSAIKNYSDKTSESILFQSARFSEALLNAKENIFYRTRFLLSNLLKEDYLIAKKSVPKELSNTISLLTLPRYVWLVELSYGEDTRNELGDSKRSIFGEIIIDATGEDDPISIIAAHFPGWLITNGIYDINEESSFISRSINNDCKYESYDRSRQIKL